jgi:hypothetical protein
MSNSAQAINLEMYNKLQEEASSTKAFKDRKTCVIDLANGITAHIARSADYEGEIFWESPLIRELWHNSNACRASREHVSKGQISGEISLSADVPLRKAVLSKLRTELEKRLDFYAYEKPSPYFQWSRARPRTYW